MFGHFWLKSNLNFNDILQITNQCKSEKSTEGLKKNQGIQFFSTFNHSKTLINGLNFKVFNFRMGHLSQFLSSDLRIWTKTMLNIRKSLY